MKVEFTNPFIKAVTSVIESEIQVKLTRKELKVKQNPSPSHPTFIIIGVTGIIKGQVVYSMDWNFAYEVAKAMLPDKLPVELKRMTNSAVSELANMITGRASIELAGENNVVNITPPAVFTGAPVFYQAGVLQLREMGRDGALPGTQNLLQFGYRQFLA